MECNYILDEAVHSARFHVFKDAQLATTSTCKQTGHKLFVVMLDPSTFDKVSLEDLLDAVIDRIDKTWVLLFH